jgi:hypothetical protein
MALAFGNNESMVTEGTKTLSWRINQLKFDRSFGAIDISVAWVIVASCFVFLG